MKTTIVSIDKIRPHTRIQAAESQLWIWVLPHHKHIPTPIYRYTASLNHHPSPSEIRAPLQNRVYHQRLLTHLRSPRYLIPDLHYLHLLPPAAPTAPDTSPLPAHSHNTPPAPPLQTPHTPSAPAADHSLTSAPPLDHIRNRTSSHRYPPCTTNSCFTPPPRSSYRKTQSTPGHTPSTTTSPYPRTPKISRGQCPK
jgi:hypothetical protein